jgi:hypothetical protein
MPYLRYLRHPEGRADGRQRRAPSAGRLLAGAAGLATIAAVLTGAAASASATSSPRYWVATTASTTAADTGCNTAAYSTIQSAVTAAQAYETSHASAVPTVELCPGTYSEQVTITKNLTLTRANVPASRGPVVIELPASVGSDQTTGLSTTNCQAKDAAANTSAPQSVIEVCGARAGGANTNGRVSVDISRVTVQGNWPNSVCYDSLYGVLIEGGATVSLSDSVVDQIGAYPLNGCQGGVAVEAGSGPTGQVGHAILTSDSIESYQKNGITVDGPGSSARISGVTVTGDGPTGQIAQNGIQVSFGATAVVTGSVITGNNYTSTVGDTTSTGILVVGGGGSVCGLGKVSPLVKRANFSHNTLLNNDVGIALFNVNSACTKSVHTPTRDVACYNTVSNYHGYTHGPSADANVSGFVTKKYGAIGDQAGISDSGDADVICHNAISGIGYAPRDNRDTLPNPKPPAWVRPIDLFSYAPAYHASVHHNTYNGKAYKPN